MCSYLMWKKMCGLRCAPPIEYVEVGGSTRQLDTLYIYMSTVLLCISISNREIKGNKRGGIGSMGAHDAHAKQLMS